ncbi:intein C-terminal splicing region/RHS repeat-associated core domain-containing protein [Streptomyces sp. 3213]|nr:intein C-terminal splicing region/RHS repeat-associated core domain-containing protein [Streptomyces sp. 3213] [Streptomyces sp. 3213.3]
MAAKVRRRIRRRIALTVSAVLVGTLLQATVAESAAASNLAPVPASEKPLSGHGVKMLPRKTDGEPRVPKQAPKHAWAEAGSAAVTLAPDTKSAITAGDLPISLTAPAPSKSKSTSAKGKKADRQPWSGKATVRVLDAKTTKRAGVDGLLFTIQPHQGAVGDTTGVSVDYSSFAQAYGGAYAARLKLVRLPACALTSPGSKGCSTATPVTTSNDTRTHTLTATALSMPSTSSATAAPMVLAATTGSSSDHGDYKASQLSASSAWQTNLNTGDFSWSYNMPVPGVPGKLAPTVGLSYSSSGIDGRTANTNNQASWAGDGFNLWSGSIERSYKPCADDGIKNADGTKPGDVCWAYDNATMSFNGHSGELIATGTDSFRLKGDDGTKIDRIYGSDTNVRSNGAHNDEYWRVTTTDGTRYYFGYNKLPGWVSGNETTDSTWTVPVYGDDDGEPCHQTAFADSWCQQAWRWNLDYAVDVHGNAIAYYYNKETNYYARNLKPADETVYDRGGYLDRIEYGLKSSAMYGTKPLAKVDFTSAERCLPETGVTCDAATIDDKSFYWYDTPWDLNCKSGVDCTKSYSPSFWTRKRLTAVTTEVLQSSGGYSPVDTWTLNQRWGMADIDYQLLLDSVQHTGKSATPNITLPKVTFAYDQRANRLDIAGDDTAPFIKERLSTISDESGGQTDVTYSTAACDAASLPTPETNTTRCYPVYFTREGAVDPTRQWFNKYVVEAVTQTDRTKSSPDMVTRYSYLGGAAWHFDDDDGLTKEKYKTWSTWRGYAHVRVQTGGQDPVGMKSQTDHYYLRGMDGDRADSSGGTRTVTVSDDNGGTITDHDSAAGFEYKTEAYSGPSGNVLSKTVSVPWHYETARRIRSWGVETADLTGTKSTRSWTSLDGGVGAKWRQTYKTNTFENVAGRITQTDDFGDDATSADNQCTRTTYVDNTTDWILDKPSRTETVAVACTDTPDRSKQVISDNRSAYDGQDYGAAPTKGDATHVATLTSHDGKTATYTESGATYDAYGRALTTTDITGTVTSTETAAPTRTNRADGRTTTTVYSPTTGFPTTSTVTTPPATSVAASAQTTTTTYDAVRGLPTTVLDTNNKRTDTTYDALGRNLKVWLPNRSQANNDTPNYEYTYTIDGTGPVAVGTKTLKNDGTQRTGYVLFDGFLRARQTQDPGPDGGRLIADTFYDERGLTAKQFAPYYNTSAPSTSLLQLDDALSVETQTWNTYDGLGRTIKTQQVAGNGDGGTVLSTTLTSYGGDRTTVTPPQGATPTTTITDARGNTTDLLQYHAATPTGAADTTHYDYNPAGKVIGVTDAAGNTWSYGYDQRGNQTSAHAPDFKGGNSSSQYNDRNQLISTTDTRGKTITHVYDGLGRETETHDGDASGPLLTKHVWDPTGFEGQLASATRYVGGASGSAYTTTYSLYDTLYRPNRTTTTIPSVTGEEKLAGSYQTNTKYNLDGTVLSSSYPAAGSLVSEVMTPTYDDVMRPKTLTGTGGVTYITDTAYSYTGKPMQYTYQATGAKKTQVSNKYQWGTQRLDNSNVTRETATGTDKSATYGYDEAGNITSVKDVSRDGTDNQCYIYDYLGRMTEAWAQSTATCASSPSGSVLGGPAPYWQSFGYDLTGNRTSETDHDATGDSTKDIQHKYAYPAPKSAQPHTLTKVDTTGPNGISTDSYTYDNAGNTETRTVGGDKQTLVWDDEGHLAKVTEPDGSGGTKTTSYVYDADGNRLLRRTDAATTLYLGNTELTLTKGATAAKATRYYDLGSGNQAIRTDDNKLSFLIGDQNGTAQLAVNSTDLTMQQRRATPFGAARGKSPTSWPGEKGFVGGTVDDSTGLTQLGARTYDTATGRFLSVDPVMDLTKPQQINGYSYSNSSPVTYSDPSGLYYCRNGRSDNCDVHGNARGDGAWCPSANDPYCHNRPIDRGVSTNPGISKDQKKKLKKVYDYFFNPNRCFGNPVDPSPKNDVCYTQAEIDADKHLGKELLSALGDLTLIVPGIRCTLGNEGECQVYGYAASSFDAAGVEVGSARFLRALTKAARAACSFTPSTEVLMKGGRKKQIGKIKPGDKVEAADPETGKHIGARVVSARLVHLDNDLVDVRIHTGNGSERVIHTTDHHPFWDDTAKSWVSAGELSVGHTLGGVIGPNVRVVDVRNRSGSAEMYNLTVEQLHTYYVVAGDTPVLVHNAKGCPTAIALGLSRTDSNDYALHDFAEGKGAEYFEHWDDFESVVRAALKPDSKTIIHFNLEGIEDPAEWAKTANLKNPYASHLTAWELAMIKAAPPEVQARVQWDNGTNPFAQP